MRACVCVRREQNCTNDARVYDIIAAFKRARYSQLNSACAAMGAHVLARLHIHTHTAVETSASDKSFLLLASASLRHWQVIGLPWATQTHYTRPLPLCICTVHSVHRSVFVCLKERKKPKNIRSVVYAAGRMVHAKITRSLWLYAFRMPIRLGTK